MRILPYCVNGLCLREFAEVDFAAIRSWVNDPLVTARLVDRHLFGHVHSEVETQAFLESAMTTTPGVVRLVVANEGSEEYLGQVEIHWTSGETKCRFDIVLTLAASAVGGVGTRAIGLVQEFARLVLEVATVEVVIAQDNPRAQHVFRKCGFEPQGDSLYSWSSNAPMSGLDPRIVPA